MNQLQDQSWTARLPVAGLEQEQAKRQKPVKPPQPAKAPEQKTQTPASSDWRTEFKLYARALQEWTRIHFRR